MSEGNCLLQPSDQISPVVLVVPERNTEYNITARVDCSFRFSVKSGNDKGFCEEEPRQITVTEDTAGKNKIDISLKYMCYLWITLFRQDI